MKKQKLKVKGCACYGVNSIHPCFCSPFNSANKKQQVKMVEAGKVSIDGIKVMLKFA